MFGYSSTLHHPIITTIKCQFLRGQLLIISCILRVQYVCLRFMHLYFTSWPKKEVKPLSYTGRVNAFEVRFFVHPSCIWVLLQSAHLPLLWFSCLLVIAGWYNLNINCNQNIHYTNKLRQGSHCGLFFLCRVICCPTNMSRHLRHGSLGGRTCGT